MASTEKESVDELHCVLCCDDMDFSACGSCDHPICLKCCVKLRMLRKENDCPVCRAQLKEVGWFAKCPVRFVEGLSTVVDKDGVVRLRK